MSPNKDFDQPLQLTDGNDVFFLLEIKSNCYFGVLAGGPEK
jgi:hypothetical protein